MSLALYFADTDPARGLALLAEIPDDDADIANTLETRSILLAKLGKADEAESMARRAADASGDTPAEGLAYLTEWNLSQMRTARALVHARALRERGVPAAQREEVEPLILEAYRRGSAFAEIVPWAKARYAKKVPDHVADELVRGLRWNPELAPELLRAAIDVQAEEEEDGPKWKRLELARLEAAMGNDEPLRALGKKLGDADDQKEIALEWFGLGKLDEALPLIDRVLEEEPDDDYAASIRAAIAYRTGDFATARRLGEALAKRSPEEHIGYERLALALAGMGDVAGALEAATRTVELDPSCAQSWFAYATAKLASGDEPAARAALARSVAITELDPHDGRIALYEKLFQREAR